MADELKDLEEQGIEEYDAVVQEKVLVVDQQVIQFSNLPHNVADSCTLDRTDGLRKIIIDFTCLPLPELAEKLSYLVLWQETRYSFI